MRGLGDEGGVGFFSLKFRMCSNPWLGKEKGGGGGGRLEVGGGGEGIGQDGAGARARIEERAVLLIHIEEEGGQGVGWARHSFAKGQDRWGPSSQ
jgi:hypothetical protein